MEEQVVKLLEKANYAIDKVIEHTPEVIEGYIRYKTIGYIIYPIIFLILLLLVVFVGRKFGKKEYSFDYDVYFFGRYFGLFGVMLWVAFGFITILLIVQLFTSIDGLILLNTSKEIFIIEKLLRSK